MLLFVIPGSKSSSQEQVSHPYRMIVMTLGISPSDFHWLKFSIPRLYYSKPIELACIGPEEDLFLGFCTEDKRWQLANLTMES